jgi:Polyketide synthase dehydratase
VPVKLKQQNSIRQSLSAHRPRIAAPPTVRGAPPTPGRPPLLWHQARQWPLPLRSFLLGSCLPRKRGDTLHRCAGLPAQGLAQAMHRGNVVPLMFARCHIAYLAHSDCRASICNVVHRFETPLRIPALGYLKDHIVAGRAILPGAAMFETALAAARSLQPDELLEAGSGDGGSDAGFALTGVAIVAPVLLSAAGAGGAPTLQCTVDSTAGSVQLVQHPGELQSCQRLCSFSGMVLIVTCEISMRTVYRWNLGCCLHGPVMTAEYQY